MLAARGQNGQATEFLDEELKRHADWPVGFRSRLYKRGNLTALVGRRAPAVEGLEIAGKPAILFLWANYCEDCTGQSAALGRFWQKYRERGVKLVAVTRIYNEDDAAADRAKTAEVWKKSYQGLDGVPVVISTEAMQRYGGSSTPTFVFIDGAGVVRAYLQYRLTELRLGLEAESLLGKAAVAGR